MTTQVCEEAQGSESQTSMIAETIPREPESKRSPACDPDGQRSTLGLDLAFRIVLRMLAYLSQPPEQGCTGFVSVSKLAADIKQPLNLVSLIALRLGREGYLRTRGSMPDEVALGGSVGESRLGDLLLAAHPPEKPKVDLKRNLGDLARVKVKDILPAQLAQAGAPTHIKVAAASALGVIFCLAGLGLHRIPAAFASLGLTLFLVSYTLRWVGRRRNLDILPQCILEAGMAGSFLWIGFGLLDLYW